MLMKTPATERALQRKPKRVKVPGTKRKRFKGTNFYEKDPAIHKLATAVKDYYGISNITRDVIKDIFKNAKGKIAESTMVGWWHKDTFKPQNYTLEVVGNSIGLERVWRPIRKK